MHCRNRQTDIETERKREGWRNTKLLNDSNHLLLFCRRQPALMLFGLTIYSIVFTSSKAYTFYFTFQSMCSSDYKKVCATFMKLYIWLLISLALSHSYQMFLLLWVHYLWPDFYNLLFDFGLCLCVCQICIVWHFQLWLYSIFFYLHFANDRIFWFFPRSRVIDNLQKLW